MAETNTKMILFLLILLKIYIGECDYINHGCYTPICEMKTAYMIGSINETHFHVPYELHLSDDEGYDCLSIKGYGGIYCSRPGDSVVMVDKSFKHGSILAVTHMKHNTGRSGINIKVRGSESIHGSGVGSSESFATVTFTYFVKEISTYIPVKNRFTPCPVLVQYQAILFVLMEQKYYHSLTHSLIYLLTYSHTHSLVDIYAPTFGSILSGTFDMNFDASSPARKYAGLTHSLTHSLQSLPLSSLSHSYSY